MTKINIDTDLALLPRTDFVVQSELTTVEDYKKCNITLWGLYYGT